MGGIIWRGPIHIIIVERWRAGTRIVELVRVRVGEGGSGEWGWGC